MSSDLAEILQSIRTTQQNIMDRLLILEQEVRTTGTTELEVPAGWGYCSPTSPATTRIQVRQGRCCYYYTGTSNMCLGAWPDFRPSLSISAFTTAGYYRWVVCYLDLDQWDPEVGFRTFENGTEFATYDDAVNDMEQDLQARKTITNTVPVVPLCAIIIRNDGTTGAINRYLPITLSNRSQSSFAVRDMRAWIYAVG